jgi:hypothetical protein
MSMVTTGNFEVVAELSKAVLQQVLYDAWKNNQIPQSTPIASGTQFGPYKVDSGNVKITDVGLALDLIPVDNGTKIKLPATFDQIEIQNPPIPSVKLFNLTANIFVTVPIGTLPGTINVGAIIDGLPRNKVSVNLLTVDPDIQTVSSAMIQEYVHGKYTDGTIPSTYSQSNVSLGIYTADVYSMIYDDPNDAAHQIEVSQPSANQVKLRIPIYLRLSNMAIADSPLQPVSPLGIEAKIVVVAPLQISPGTITAKLTNSNITVENIIPSTVDDEGTNYNIDKAGASMFGMNLETLLIDQITLRAHAFVEAIGDINIFAPTRDQIETFIGDQVHAALLSKGNIPLWTPQIPDGSPVNVNDITPKVLADCLAMCINDRGGGNPHVLTNFIPAGYSCGINVIGAKILEVINQKIFDTYGNLPTELAAADLDGEHSGRLKTLNPSLKDGAIHFDGTALIYNALPCGGDADCSFWADIGLEWQDDDTGKQILHPIVIDKDSSYDEGALAWILGAITGGLIGILIVAIVEHVIDGIVESIGGKIIENDVTGQTTVVAPWPQVLEGIGTVKATFENPISIYSDSILFPDGYTVTPKYASTVVAFAKTNGPYNEAGSLPLMFTGGPAAPDTTYEWDIGDGTKVANRVISHTFAKHGTYISKFTTNVHQPGGIVTKEYTKVRINSVKPIVNVPANMTVDEGKEVEYSVSFTDAEWQSIHQAVFNFGDNSLPLKGIVSETKGPPYAKGTASAKHAYCRAETFTVNVKIINDDGSIGQGTFKVAVRNLPPKVEAGEDMYAYPCTPITIVAEFTDPGWCEKHTGKWEFGDWVDSQVAIIHEINKAPEARGIAAAAHIYSHLGTYVAKCTVTDEYGASGQDTITLRVVDLLNHDFEEGFHSTATGAVANRWTPYRARAQTTVSETATAVEPKSMAEGVVAFSGEEFIVHGGQRSQRITGLRMVRGGILQQVGANKDWDYQISVWHNEHGLCKCRLGIDAEGGLDPNSSSVVWTEGSNDFNWVQLALRVTAKSRLITVFLEAQFKENTADAYFDDAQLIAYPCILKMPTWKPTPKPEERCIDWSDTGKQKLGAEYEKNGFKFKARNAMQIIESGQPVGKGKLLIEPNLIVQLPFDSDKVTAQVVRHVKVPIAIGAIGKNSQTLERQSISSNIDEVAMIELKSAKEPIAAIHFIVDEPGDLLVSLCTFPQGSQKEPLSATEVKSESSISNRRDKANVKRKRKKQA